MNKKKILTDMLKSILQEFSSKSIEELNKKPSLKIILHAGSEFIEDNVRKEIEKDRIVIDMVFRAIDEQDSIKEDIDMICERVKEIDRDFLKKISNLPFSIEINYDRICEVREERVMELSELIKDIIKNWNHNMSFEDAVRSAYTPQRFRERLENILYLYSVETRILGDHLKLCFPLNTIKDLFVKNLFSIMKDLSSSIARRWTEKIYGL